MNLNNLTTAASQPLSHDALDNHYVQICQDEASQAEILTRYIRDGLINDEAVIVIARTALRKTVTARLYTLGYDMQTLKNKDQVKFFDAEFLLSDLLVDGVFEEQAFQMFVVLPVQAAKLKYGKVRAFGEMVDVLWKNGQHDLAIQLEDLWNALCKKEELKLLCTYFLASLDENSYDHALEHICKCHPYLVPMNKAINSNADADAKSPNKFWVAWNRVVAKLEGSHQIVSEASF